MAHAQDNYLLYAHVRMLTNSAGRARIILDDCAAFLLHKMWHNFHVERLLEKQLVVVESNEGAEVGACAEKSEEAGACAG